MKKRYIWCNDCKALIRLDTGEYCDHYIAKNFPSIESVTVVFRGPNGDVSIPWDHSSPTPEGYVREELRGSRALRKLERELDAKDIKRHAQYQEKVERQFYMQREQRRRDLHDMIRTGVAVVQGADGSKRTIHLSERGRDLARAQLERGQRGYSERYDPGNHRDR